MKVKFTQTVIRSIIVSASLFSFFHSYSQCITTLESRENIISDVTLVPGSKTHTINSNNLNVGYQNHGEGTKLTLNFSGSNKTYSNDTIRFVGNMIVENLTRGNNNFNNLVLVVTANSDVIFKNIDINNSNNIKFINYGIMTFQNSFTLSSNTIFINKTASSVLTFKQFINFANNSNITVLYSNGGIVNFNGGFQLQSENKICLTGNTQVNTTSIGNNVNSGIYVPASFSACIKYTTTATLNNTLFTGPGALSVAQNPGASNASLAQNWGSSIVRANSSSCNLILPVTLKSFEVIYDEKSIVANWLTATEINLASFEIERSMDGVNFKKVGTIKAKGNSSTTEKYAFKDASILNALNYFYRLKMIDADGKFSYSAIKEISIHKTAGKLLATKIGEQVLVQFPAITNKASLMMYDMTGRNLLQQSLSAGQTSSMLTCKNLAHGSYIVVLVNDGKKETIHIVL